MPRIRKKTSNRATTHQRAKLKHKIAEGRKKNRKQAKKNPQWKSKKKKDPGIPNDFPYKDQILAEIADTRRQAEEAKQRRKEEKKAAREGGLVQGTEDVEVVEEVESSSSKALPKEPPLLLNPDLPNLKAVLNKADVVLHILDARDPLSFRLPHIEDVVLANEKAKLVFVLNKIDLVPRETLVAWVTHLRTQQATFLFRSASAFLPKAPINDPKVKGKAKESPADAFGADELLEYLGQWADVIQSETLQVAVVGVTNTGKSAIINSLARKAAVPVYTPTPSTDTWSTTTPRAYEVVLTASAHTINLIDTPGVSLHKGEDGDAPKLQDMLLRRRGRVDKLKDPVPAVEHIVARADTTDLMVQYSLPAFGAGDTAAFLAGVARSHGVAKKGGAPDAAQAARMVLRDWTTGKLPVYADASELATVPLEEDALKELYARADAVALQAVRTRGEMRRGAGLVKMVPGVAEARKVDLEALFAGDTEESTDEESAGEEAEAVEDDEDDEDEDDDGDDDDEEDASDEDAPVPLRGKRKRAVGATKAAPPSKKVAFAAGTLDRKERNQSRAAKSGDVKSKDGKSRISKDAKSPKDGKLKEAKPKVPKPKPANPSPPKKAAAKAASKATISTTDTDAYDFNQFFK